LRDIVRSYNTTISAQNTLSSAYYTNHKKTFDLFASVDTGAIPRVIPLLDENMLIKLLGLQSIDLVQETLRVNRIPTSSLSVKRSSMIASYLDRTNQDVSHRYP
jgi:sorbitol-specific phosphotransferase system component IIC